MVVEVTKEKVVIKESSVINTDEIGINKCRFILPSCFHGLEVTALFNYIPVPLVDNECIIPSLGKGNAVLGVYAYKSEGDEPQIMYSPKPASFYVSQGSYSEQVNEAAVVQISLYEQYCKMLAEKYKEEELAREEAEAIRVTAENLRLQAEQDRVSAELVRSEAFSNIFDRDGNIVIGSDDIENGAVTLDKVSQYFFRDGVNCTVGNDITLHLTQKVPDNKVYLSAELTSKTDEITEDSTNEIPTAKAVFDYVNEFGGGSDYTLPVGGDELGGVKNGGNVVINEDGTMNAPETEVTDEQVNTAVNAYLTEHPVDGSMSADAKNLLLVILQNASYLSDQKSNIEALAAALSTEMPDADTETWDYEWDYSMGSLTDNGFSFDNGYNEWTNEFTDKGQLVSYIGSRNSYAVQGRYTPLNFATTTTHAIIECVIEIKEFETNTSVDQGFIIALSDGTNVAAIYADNLGFRYDEGTIASIALDTEYKVRLEFDTENGVKCSINGKEVLNTVNFVRASIANTVRPTFRLMQMATGSTYIKSVKYREVTE